MKPIKIKISAFGPFPGEIPEISFEQFYENGLFLISGRTGAGKTTIFDAICYALYGQTSGSYRDNKNLRSEYADLETDSYVDFYFEHQGKNYHVRRNPAYERKKARGAGTTIQPEKAAFYEEGKAPVEGITQVNKAIEDLLHISFAQFKQIVMIAQNEFKDMLNASTDDRTKILRKIFMTEKYEEIVRRLKNKKDVSEEIKKEAEKEMVHHFREVTAQEDSELQSELVELQEKAEEADSAWNTDEIISITEKIVDIDTEKSKTVKEQLEKCETELNGCKEKLATAKLNNDFIEKFENLKKEKEQLEEQKEEIEHLRDIVPRQKTAAHTVAPVYDRLHSKIQENREAKSTIDEGEKQLDELSQAAHQASEELQAASAKREEAEDLKKSWNRISEDKERYLKRDSLIGEISGIEEQQSVLADQQEAIEKKETDLAERIKEYNEIIEMLKGRPGELTGISTDEREMSALMSGLEKITGQMADSWREQKGLLVEEQKKFETAREQYDMNAEAKRQAERIYENDKAGLLASKLTEGEKCPVCGSTHHPEPAKLSEDSISEEELNKLKEKEDKSRIEKEKAFAIAESKKTALEVTENSIREEAEVCFADPLVADDAEVAGGAEVANGIETANGIEAADDAEAAGGADDISEIIEKAKGYQDALGHRIKELKEKREALEKDCERLDTARELLSKAQGEETSEVKEEKELVSGKLRNLDVDLARAKASLEENQDLGFENWEAAEKEMMSQKEKSEKLFKAISDAEQVKKSAENALTDKEAEIRTLKEGFGKSKDEEKQLKEKFDALLDENSFDGVEEFLQFNVNEQVIDAGEKSISDYDADVKSNTTQLAQAEKEAKGRKYIDIDSLKEKTDLKQADVDAARTQLGDLSTRIKINSEKVTAIKALKPKYEKAKKESGTLSKLHNLVSGQTGKGKITLEQYVQATGFDRILKAANRRLVPISDGQFQLFRRENSLGKRSNTSLDLDVLDNYTGHKRPVGNLSGGESFKASLSLALGLSDTVSSDVGGVQTDALFIDEGFGSLDSESIESARETLMNLSGSNKLIGIISHREELKETIQQQIKVSKTREGSTVEIDLET